MDPTQLLGPTNSLGLPAPFWFIEFFKVLGFSLHVVPMNLWYAGVILASILSAWGSANGKRLSQRLMMQMPFIIAFGVNLGIVPLLFTQVAYYRVFYPTTILIALPWLGVIPLLLVAYYGLYLYAIQLRHQNVTRLGRAAGWVSALFFIAIGFIFANNFSLMTNLNMWVTLWQATNVAGAPLGTALNLLDPTLLPRWLMMFGLALTTVAAYVVAETSIFAAKENDDYKLWAPRFAIKLSTLGIAWFAIAGSLYIFAGMREDIRAMLLTAPMLTFTVLTAISPGLTWALILAQRDGVAPRLAVLTGLAQFVAIALNAVSRQIVQNAELAKYLDVSAEPVQLQLSPLVVFLVLLVVGLAVVVWMVMQVVRASRAAPVQT
jgi:hypothetical protein